MSFPVIDPTQGVQLTSDGRDIVLIWPTDTEWIASVLRCTLWQFKGAWKYDRSRGIDYLTEVHGQVTSIAVLQALFRRALSRYIKIDRLIVNKPDDETVSVTFRGPATLGQDITIELLENPAIEAVVPERAEIIDGTTISIRFSEELNRYALPAIEDFELLFTDETVTAVAINGTHLTLTLSGAVLSTRVVYHQGEIPMQAVSRTLVEAWEMLAYWEEYGGSGFLMVASVGEEFLSVGSVSGGLEVTE